MDRTKPQGKDSHAGRQQDGTVLPAGLYARVSTKDKNQDPEVQLQILRRFWADKSGHLKGWQEYVDYASGASTDRPALKKLLSACRSGKYEVVICTRIDRFARSTRDLMNMLYDLKAWKVGFITTEQPIDTSSPMGEFTLTILGAAATLERQLIVERVREGLEKAASEGRKGGRRPISIDPDVLAAFLGQGLKPQAIASQLGVSRTTVYKALKSIQGMEGRV